MCSHSSGYYSKEFNFRYRLVMLDKKHLNSEDGHKTKLQLPTKCTAVYRLKIPNKNTQLKIPNYTTVTIFELKFTRITQITQKVRLYRIVNNELPLNHN